jgi:hypothetical protein
MRHSRNFAESEGVTVRHAISLQTTPGGVVAVAPDHVRDVELRFATWLQKNEDPEKLTIRS